MNERQRQFASAEDLRVELTRIDQEKASLLEQIEIQKTEIANLRARIKKEAKVSKEPEKASSG